MNKRRKDALASIGISVTRYFVEGFPPVWGIALTKDGVEFAVVESHGCHTEDDALRNKYAVRNARAVATVKDDYGLVKVAPTLGIFKTQREAVAAIVSNRYQLGVGPTLRAPLKAVS